MPGGFARPAQNLVISMEIAAILVCVARDESITREIDAGVNYYLRRLVRLQGNYGCVKPAAGGAMKPVYLAQLQAEFQQPVAELARGRAGTIWPESEACGGSRRGSSTTTRNEAVGPNPARPKGCGGARSRLCRSSSPMSRIACVAAPRRLPGGARNAAHGSSTTGC